MIIITIFIIIILSSSTVSLVSVQSVSSHSAAAAVLLLFFFFVARMLYKFQCHCVSHCRRADLAPCVPAPTVSESNKGHVSLDSPLICSCQYRLHLPALQQGNCDLGERERERERQGDVEETAFEDRETAGDRQMYWKRESRQWWHHGEGERGAKCHPLIFEPSWHLEAY